MLDDLLMIAACAPLVLAVHVAGHALGGRLVAIRPAGLPLRHGFHQPSGTDLRRRWLAAILGGPIISLMAGAQCLAVWTAIAPMLLDGNASWHVRALSSSLILVGIGSLLLGVGTLLPLRLGSVATDGHAALRLLREDADVASITARYVRG